MKKINVKNSLEGQPPPRVLTGESGVFIVIGALWISVFLMLTALAIDTYMLAAAKLQQGNTVEYIALSTLHSLKDPPTGATYTGEGTNEADKYNFAIGQGAAVGESQILGLGQSQVSPSQLYVRAVTDPHDDVGEGCGEIIGGSGPSGPSGPSGGGQSDTCGINAECEESGGVKDKWCGFESSSSVGAIVFGTYNPSNGKFQPASSGSLSSVDAVSVRLQLPDATASPLVLPMMKMIMSNGNFMFESRATAYRNASGKYMLVATN